MLAAAPVPAGHRPTAYCSESGDVCASARKHDGIRKLRITLAAKYFNDYKLCVTAPDDSRKCKDFKIHKQNNGTFGDVVRWNKHFADKGGGAYTVRWKGDGGFKSKRLGFHVKK